MPRIPASHRAEQILAERLGAVGRGSELEDAQKIIPGLGNHVDRGHAVAVSIHSVALNTVTRVELGAALQMRQRSVGTRAAQQLGSQGPAATLAKYLGNLLLKLGFELLGLGADGKAGSGRRAQPTARKARWQIVAPIAMRSLTVALSARDDASKGASGGNPSRNDCSSTVGSGLRGGSRETMC